VPGAGKCEAHHSCPLIGHNKAVTPAAVSIPAQVTPVLASGVVHVWRIPLDSSAAAGCDLSQLLTPGEQARASRFTRAEDRLRFQLGRAATRCILGRYLGLAPSAVVIDPDRHGKPQLNAWLVPVEPRVHFNVSHSGGWIVAAFAVSYPVGIDIEQIRPEAVSEELKAYFMSDGERRSLRSLPPARQAAAFFKCWTSKEALLKGLGLGVTVDLKGIEVSVDPDLPAELLAAPPGLLASGWQLRTLECSPSYAATLAVAAGPAERVEVVDILIDRSVFAGKL